MARATWSGSEKCDYFCLPRRCVEQQQQQSSTCWVKLDYSVSCLLQIIQRKIVYVEELDIFVFEIKARFDRCETLDTNFIFFWTQEREKKFQSTTCWGSKWKKIKSKTLTCTVWSRANTKFNTRKKKRIQFEPLKIDLRLARDVGDESRRLGKKGLLCTLYSSYTCCTHDWRERETLENEKIQFAIILQLFFSIHTQAVRLYARRVGHVMWRLKNFVMSTRGIASHPSEHATKQLKSFNFSSAVNEPYATTLVNFTNHGGRPFQSREMI